MDTKQEWKEQGCKGCVWSHKKDAYVTECRLNPPIVVIDQRNPFPLVQEDWWCSKWDDGEVY